MITEKDFIAKTVSNFPEEFHSKWSAPSNIALVKYWGKKDDVTTSLGEKASQIPANPSLSFTLSTCKTITSINFTKKSSTSDFSFELWFEGKPKPEFHEKIQKYFERIAIYCSYLKNYHLKIETTNTFPHSSGIASSASAMAALSVNIMSLEKEMFPEITQEYFTNKASFLARLGSGSACRSIHGKTVVWGNHQEIENSSDLLGIAIDEKIHPIFQSFQDTILLVDKGEKQVSSTVGHNLMHGHPFANERFNQAHENISKLLIALENGDLETFISIVESEALTLHAMMMTSMPYFILMQPNTLEIIKKIWKFRIETSLPVCFTLDAGANIHLLYPENISEPISQFIKNELVAYCKNGDYICDTIGNGATTIL